MLEGRVGVHSSSSQEVGTRVVISDFCVIVIVKNDQMLGGMKGLYISVFIYCSNGLSVLTAGCGTVLLYLVMGARSSSYSSSVLVALYCGGDDGRGRGGGGGGGGVYM